MSRESKQIRYSLSLPPNRPLPRFTPNTQSLDREPSIRDLTQMGRIERLGTGVLCRHTEKKVFEG
jgi:hypothetical protein